ncbi:MAG TPA: PRC-barrel domain-containing protein [Gaiellaceae bacterium]|nr:PRC-barrel domain-containing protein [Gaiellaceae bacterium]
MSAPDPVSWRAVQQGWSVLDAEGNEIGKVDQVTGDLNADIFDGITVGDGGTVLTRARYVPAENVAEIREGVIRLDLSAADAAKLAPYTEPVVEPLEALEPQAEEERKSQLNWAQRLWLTTLGRKP